MSLLRKIEDYISERDFELHVHKNQINIVNYIGIPDFSNTKVTIKYRAGIVVISGKDLIVSKLINDEILINGKVKQIEFR